MLFQLMLTTFFKSELFSCLPKVDHVIKSCKEPILQQKSNQQVTKKIKTLAVRTGVRAYTDATLLTTSAYLKQCKSFHHLHNLLCMSTNMTQQYLRRLLSHHCRNYDFLLYTHLCLHDITQISRVVFMPNITYKSCYYLFILLPTNGL